MSVVDIIKDALNHLRYPEEELKEMKEAFTQPTEELKNQMFIMLLALVDRRIEENKIEQEKIRNYKPSSLVDQFLSGLPRVVRSKPSHTSTVHIEEID